MPHNPPLKGSAYTFRCALPDANRSGLFKGDPTIASGDFKVDKDGGGLANLTTLPILESPFAGGNYPENAMIPSDAVLLLRGEGSDGSQTILDTSASAHTVTVNGNTQIDTAQYAFGAASILFDGTGDYLALPVHTDFAFGTGDFTVSCWVRLAVADYTHFIDFRSGGIGWLIYVGGAPPNLNFVFYANSGALSTGGSTNPNANIWYHVAVTRSSGNTRLFINGVQEGLTLSDTINYPCTAAPTIGADQGGALYFLNGWIDDLFLIKGRALWVANFQPPYRGQVLLLKGDGADGSTTIIDSSQAAHTVTVGGNTQLDTAQFKYGGSSILFDGTGDYLELDGSADFDFGVGDFTISIWARYNGALPGANRSIITWDANRTLMFDANNKLQFFNLIVSTTTLVGDVWYHCAITRSNGTTRLFLNGVQEASLSDSYDYQAVTTYPVIGNYLGGNQWSGWLEDIQVIKGRALWTANFTPPQGRLVKVPLSATEMNADVVTVVAHDQTDPAEWCDTSLTIVTRGS